MFVVLGTSNRQEVRSKLPGGRKEMTNLFQFGSFILHSGEYSDFKIDCDALTDDDLKALAFITAKRLPPYWKVEGVPSGGLRFALSLQKYLSDIHTRFVLIVDDVLTTGASMERQRDGRNAIGVVIFARGPVPDWVIPLFVMTP